jgi:hypothetical protein
MVYPSKKAYEGCGQSDNCYTVWIFLVIHLFNNQPNKKVESEVKINFVMNSNHK